MHFNRMELAGFKSFADKTEIKFDEGVTAIVGPNGCGKSNVGDAIRWVLGEQSSKNLRGSSMQDVIFSGTEKRKSLSYCEVTLYFNNQDHFFDIDYEDLSVTRKLYRSGESEYQINKNQCRLKDIVNLFFDSGIGRDGYSIIGQGKVEEIISSKPEARRKIFEEAAGIAKFKSRKEEAEKKLERTRDNLTRIRDIIGEIDRQLGPMKRQAETAKKYLELRDLLRELEINVYIYQYEHSGEVKEQINERMNGILEELSLRQADIVGANQKYDDCMLDIADIDNKIKKLNDEILVLTVGIEKQAGETKLMQERINNIKSQNEKIEIDILNLKNTIAKNTAEKEFKEKRKIELNQQAKEIEENSGEYSALVQEYSKLKVLEVNINAKIKQSEQNLHNLNAKIQVYENRKRLLEEMQAEFEGYGNAVKRLLKESEKNTAIKDKMVGVLASLIKVPEKFETAIEVALGNAVQNIVTVNEDNAKILINHLKANKMGRATFLPISSMKPRFISAETQRTLNTPGCFGIASDLISFDKKIQNVVQNLLGATVIVDTLETAVNMAKNSKFSYKIVTLEGDVISPTGSMTGGSRKSDAVNLISRAREITTLATEVENLKVDYQNQQTIINELMQKLESVQRKIEESDKKKNSTELSEAVKITEIRMELNALETDFERINSSINEAKQLISINAQQLDTNKTYIEQEQENIKAYIAQNSNSEAQIKLEVIKHQQKQFELNKASLQESLKIISDTKEKLMQEISTINDRKVRAEVELTKLISDMETMQERIYEEYELTYSTCQDYRKENFDFEKALPEVSRLKKEINKLGPVNVNAIDDSKALFERYTDLSTQAEDLEKAEADTVKVIEDLAQEMSIKFIEQFEKINANFKITFKELFGGGNASLELVGSEDVLQAGVDINAEPPGKKLQNITLLSGGEKALTAIAILFAILKLKPMPFCLLDEIEAALDEANVERFAQYLRRFSGDTQFIVVTHRKPTMELADSLYGVTMEEKGVSRLVSVKLSEAIANETEMEEMA